MKCALFVVGLAALLSLGCATSGVPEVAPSGNTRLEDLGLAAPEDYVVGVDDVLGVLFWRDESLSGDVVVRPDGKISLPLLNEVEAAGLTTEQLRERLTEKASQYLDSPTVTVVVREINSRKVYITGEVVGPGTYPLSASMTVMQLFATAGGLRQNADEDEIVILRVEDGTEKLYRFNYRHVLEDRNVQQNIKLQPGDTVIVP